MKENTGFFKGILALALVLGVLLTACTVEPENSSPLVGKWSRTSGGTTYTYLFNNNGSGSYAQGANVSNFTWSVTDNVLKLTFGNSPTESYIWSVDGNTLKLTAQNSAQLLLYKQ